VLKNAEGTLSVEVEPNNNSENANPIYSGVTVSGNFVNGDLDMYSFSLSNPSILTFSSDELYGDVTIYAPDSSVIFKEETLYRDTFQVAGVQSGTYLININRNSYSPAQYSFKLTFDQAAINQDAEIIELKSQVSTLTSEKTSLEAQLQTANTRISELESELATLKSQQSSNSNPSSTTNTSNNQSSSSSSTAVEVKKVASIKAYGLQFSLSPADTRVRAAIPLELARVKQRKSPVVTHESGASSSHQIPMLCVPGAGSPIVPTSPPSIDSGFWLQLRKTH
jgi:hypothetical protein